MVPGPTRPGFARGRSLAIAVRRDASDTIWRRMNHATGSKVECTQVLDDPRGWACRVRIGSETSGTDHEIRLAWCDHDHWTGGLIAPGELIERLVRFLLEARVSPAHPDAAIPWPLPAKFDAAKARRWCPAVDSELRTVG